MFLLKLKFERFVFEELFDLFKLEVAFRRDDDLALLIAVCLERVEYNFSFVDLKLLYLIPGL
jgi:hypothetical protein